MHGTFNGLVVTDINAPLMGVSVSTNLNKIAVWDQQQQRVTYENKAWDPSTMMTFDANSVRFNWSDFVFYCPGQTPYYFNASLTFGQETVVPEPASFLLFGAGGITTALIRRRRKA